MLYDPIKRMLDIIGAGILVLFVLPILILAILLILILDRHNPLFLQERVGKDQQLFTCYKLRTMRSGNDSDDKRLTWLGKLLRKASIDELPQLWNVLKGEMSMVGPRPLLPEYIPLYSVYQNQRHRVLPGITGWAQVHRRRSLSWNDRFELDVQYVENYSMGMDLKILVLTIREVVVGFFVSTEKGSFEKFKGNQHEK